MMYRIVLDELVLEKDLKRIDPRDQERILRAIKKKLSEGPGNYGIPLGGGLKGFWKLKVGQYRVVYRIVEKEKLVDVALVGFRRNEEAYDKMMRRVKPPGFTRRRRSSRRP
jgi:mRNA interferase RelE/StbE